jgi:hypothetical protein
MSGLVRIARSSLETLKNLYRVDWPVHVVSYTAIDHFIHRFNQQPEWEEKVKFWTLGDDWKRHGTFVMENVSDGHILINTTQAYPYESLSETLNMLSYDDERVFACFHDKFRPLVQDLIRVKNLEETFDSGAKCVHLPKETWEKFDLQ